MTVKLTGLEVPPPGAGLVTVTASTPVEAMLEAAMAAVNCVELTNVVAGAAPPKLTIEAATKLVPLIVSVKAAPPADGTVRRNCGDRWSGWRGLIVDGLTRAPSASPHADHRGDNERNGSQMKSHVRE